ncbi:hypothetical protein BGX38DRAFT_1275756 [Terfezia claveryi]|nr:hypothetical protein BGX38DRAFT_1275756 [Terfezia claveryi]
MTLMNITVDIGNGISIVGPTFWANSGVNAKIIGMACGFAVAIFRVAAGAAKWLSHHESQTSNQASSTGAVKLTSIVSKGEAEPAPAAGTTSGPEMPVVREPGVCEPGVREAGKQSEGPGWGGEGRARVGMGGEGMGGGFMFLVC